MAFSHTPTRWQAWTTWDRLAAKFVNQLAEEFEKVQLPTEEDEKEACENFDANDDDAKGEADKKAEVFINLKKNKKIKKEEKKRQGSLGDRPG
jgi:hypothetical protein